MEQQQQKFEAWAVVELFGHQRVAGRLSEQAIGGETFLRVDVPASSGHAEYSRLFGKGAIYCINLCDEATARAAAAYVRPPLKAYEPLPTLAAPDGVAVTRAQVDDDYDFGDDEPPL